MDHEDRDESGRDRVREPARDAELPRARAGKGAWTTPKTTRAIARRMVQRRERTGGVAPAPTGPVRSRPAHESDSTGADMEAALLGREPAPLEARIDGVRALRLRVEGALIEDYQDAVARLDESTLKSHARSIARAMQDEERAVIELGATARASVRPLEASQGAFRARVLRAMGPGFGAPVAGPGEEDVNTAVFLAYQQMRGLVAGARLMRSRLERAGSPEASREAAQACAREITRWAGQSPAYVLFLQRALQREGLFGRIAGARNEQGQSVAYMTVAALDSLGGPPRTVEGMFLQLAKLRDAWVRPAPDYAGIVAALDDILVALRRMCDRERFDALRGRAGAGTQTLSLAFGAADSIQALQRLARLGQGGPGRGGLWDLHVTRLHVAREPVEILAGERSLAGSTIAAVDRATYVSLGAYGALFGAVVGGAALVELAPVLAVEAELLWAAGRAAYTWALANPAVATEIAAFFTGLGLEMADAGVMNTLARMSTPEGAAMVLVEILLVRKGAQGEGSRPSRQPGRQPAPEQDPGKLRAQLEEIRVRARALRSWARERLEGATAGTTSDGRLSAVPGRSLDEHVQDARQQNLLSKAAEGRGAAGAMGTRARILARGRAGAWLTGRARRRSRMLWPSLMARAPRCASRMTHVRDEVIAERTRLPKRWHRTAMTWCKVLPSLEGRIPTTKNTRSISTAICCMCARSIPRMNFAISGDTHSRATLWSGSVT